MASPEPHKVFLITEILEMILLQTHTRTLLTSAQRVCRKWRFLIQKSRDLQATLFFKPIRYSLPRGTPSIRNPLLEECIWPWFCARQARDWRAPPVEGGAKIPQFDPETNRLFLQEGASWKRMLFQQPPRSCIGFIEKNCKDVNGPAYTKVKVRPRGHCLRIHDVILPDMNILNEFHPLPEEGLLWHGCIRKKELLKYAWQWEFPADDEKYGEITRSQIAYAASRYLQDCDIVFFLLWSGRIQGQWVSNYGASNLNYWFGLLGMSLVPEQTSIPMPVTWNAV